MAYFCSTYSICGYATAILFKDINEDDIKYVEKYTQENIPALIDLNQQDGPKLNKQQLSIFFGAYGLNPKLFEFTQGNRKLIKAVIQSINDSIADATNEQAGLAIWNQKTKCHWWKNLCATPMGLFYGDIDEFGFSSVNPSKLSGNKQLKKGPPSVDELKKQLFEKTKEVLKAYANMVNPLCDFTEDLISVEIINGVLVKGAVKCNCCVVDSPVRRVKMFYQQTNCSRYWVGSNFARHLCKHHTTKLPAESVQYANVTLEIEPVLRECGEKVEFDCNAIEDFLFTQMSKQNIELVNTTHSNNEEIVDFFVNMDLESMKSSKSIKICKIDGDGSCLFGSLAHQISFPIIGSANHKILSIRLRKQCVDHIKANFDRYIPFLKSRLIEIHGNEKFDMKNLDVKKQCRQFLDSTLPLHETFGGVESIKAVSEIQKVNIITVTENGDCNLVHLLDTKYGRTVFIAYRNGNHYDSVAEIDARTISDFAKKSAHNHTALSNGENIVILTE